MFAFFFLIDCIEFYVNGGIKVDIGELNSCFIKKKIEEEFSEIIVLSCVLRLFE